MKVEHLHFEPYIMPVTSSLEKKKYRFATTLDMNAGQPESKTSLSRSTPYRHNKI